MAMSERRAPTIVNNYYPMVPGLRLSARREMSLRSKVHIGHAKHFGKARALSLSWGKDAPGASSLSAGGKEVALREHTTSLSAKRNPGEPAELGSKWALKPHPERGGLHAPGSRADTTVT